MHIIFGNYGDNTVAVMQWCYLNQLSNVTVINVDTGWGAIKWQDRVQEGKELANRFSFNTITLKPTHNFAELVLDRQSFPNQKYQWCPTFLKAMPLLAWLDDNDPSCEALMVLGSSRTDSRARKNLSEFEESNEYYGDRRVWYPLVKMTKEEKNALIVQAGFKPSHQRSLECQPCIHSTQQELTYLTEDEILKVIELERAISQTMFSESHLNQISLTQRTKTQSATFLEWFDMGCGSRYVCGE